MNKQNCKLVAFLQKTYSILNNPNHNSVITWDVQGKYISILDSAIFQTQVLPIYFKHKNMKSFVRQLNLYGFRKIKKGLCRDTFYHSQFQRDKQDSLYNIKRRKQKSDNIVQIEESHKLVSSNIQTSSSFISKYQQQIRLQAVREKNKSFASIAQIQANYDQRCYNEWHQKPFHSICLIQENGSELQFIYG